MKFMNLGKKALTILIACTLIMGQLSFSVDTTKYHTVKSGDTLFKIAKSVQLTLDQLLSLNPQIKNPNKIYRGQELVIDSAIAKEIASTTKKVIVAETIVLPANLNGFYRGTYFDGNEQQVGVEFTLKNDVIEKAQYRSLMYKGINYLQATDNTLVALKIQYEALLKSVLGKTVSDALVVLQKPELLVKDTVLDTDTLTSATLRSQKIASALKDGINRSPYSLDDISVIYDDGIYRGVFIDGNIQQIGVEFTLKNNKVDSIKYDTLIYKDVNYYNESATEKTVALTKQYETLINYLKGKNLNTHLDALRYSDLIAGNAVVGADTTTGATLRNGKVISAIKDALNRGVYKPLNAVSVKEDIYVKTYSNGTYRGQFINKGEHQVSVEFTLKDGTIDSIKYKVLAYKGLNYLTDQDSAKIQALKSQYDDLINYLKGKSLKSITSLYVPEKITHNITVDLDTLTSATVRSGKIISAINDALIRGVYKLD